MDPADSCLAQPLVLEDIGSWFNHIQRRHTFNLRSVFFSFLTQLFVVSWLFTLGSDLKFPLWFGSHLCSLVPPSYALILYLLPHQLTLCPYSLPAETVLCIILDRGLKELYCELCRCKVPVNVNGVRGTEEINECWISPCFSVISMGLPDAHPLDTAFTLRLFFIHEGHIYHHSPIIWFHCSSSSSTCRLIELNGECDCCWAPREPFILGHISKVCREGHLLSFSASQQCYPPPLRTL